MQFRNADGHDHLVVVLNLLHLLSGRLVCDSLLREICQEPMQPDTTTPINQRLLKAGLNKLLSVEWLLSLCYLV